MVEGRGGKRTPRNPAPVPMPGALSRRTDGGPAQSTTPMTGMGYGENADFNDVQSSAPLAAAPSVPNARTRKTSPTGNGAAAAPTPLFAPTARPDEPITAGAPFGPGPGVAPPQVTDPNSIAAIYSRIAANDPSGDAEYFLSLALRLGL